MKKKRGAVLILTLLVMLLLLALGAAVYSTASINYKTQIISDNIEKLNVMTESGMEVALAQIKKVKSSDGFVDIMALKSEDNSITCNVKFYKNLMYVTETGSYISAVGKHTIESTASNNINSRTLRVLITEGTKAPGDGSDGRSTAIPTNYLFFVNGAVANGNFNCALANGGVYVNGNFHTSSGSSIKGKLISTGNMKLEGGNSSANGVISFGNLSLDGGGVISGDTLVKGNISFGGGTKVNGNVQSDSNLIMPQGNIANNATIGGNAIFSGGGSKIAGKLYYKGTATSTWGTVADFVRLGAVKTTSYTPIDLSNYSIPKLPVIAVPTIFQSPWLYIPVSTKNNKINSSGSLYLGMFNLVSYGSTITIDTSSSDISLLVNSFNFNPGRGLNFEVTGPNNLYIYLKGILADFTVTSNQFIGMKNRSSASQIYIIGEGNQSVNISNCELNANIYLPNGSFSASGGALSTYIFQGSCVSKSVNIQNNISANYVKPNIIGTPLEILNNGNSDSDSDSGTDTGSGSSNWILDKWYD